MKTLTTILAALALTTSLSLAAQGDKKEKAAGNPEEMFKKADTNGDGKISKEEWVAGKKNSEKAEKAFANKDKDGDGFLSMDEAKGGKHAAGGAKKEEHAKPAGTTPSPTTANKDGDATKKDSDAGTGTTTPAPAAAK